MRKSAPVWRECLLITPSYLAADTNSGSQQNHSHDAVQGSDVVDALPATDLVLLHLRLLLRWMWPGRLRTFACLQVHSLPLVPFPLYLTSQRHLWSTSFALQYECSAWLTTSDSSFDIEGTVTYRYLKLHWKSATVISTIATRVNTSANSSSIEQV